MGQELSLKQQQQSRGSCMALWPLQGWGSPMWGQEGCRVSPAVLAWMEPHSGLRAHVHPTGNTQAHAWHGAAVHHALDACALHGLCVP